MAYTKETLVISNPLEKLLKAVEEPASDRVCRPASVMKKETQTIGLSLFLSCTLYLCFYNLAGAGQGEVDVVADVLLA